MNDEKCILRKSYVHQIQPMYVVDSELTDTDTHLTFVRVHALDTWR